MIFLLYKGGFETAENLAGALTERISNFRATVNIKRIVRRRGIFRRDALIRWGTTRDEEVDDIFYSKGALVLNPAQELIGNVDKLNSLRVFRAAGVNCPNFWTDKKMIPRFPVLGRNREHRGGKDVVLINGSAIPRFNDYSKIPDKCFYTEFICSTEEFRVHVFEKDVIRVTKKVFRGHDRFDSAIEERQVIRNDTYGWGHSAVDTNEFIKKYPDAVNHSIRAVASLGLNFGAIDLILRQSDNKPFVLEVNSCPRLNSVGMQVYVEAILKKLKERLQKGA